jgi:hypothetical protein
MFDNEWRRRKRRKGRLITDTEEKEKEFFFPM